MKKLFVIAIIGASIFYLKPEIFINAKEGAFDENGDPEAWIFTFNECGKPCDDAISTLDKRVKYTLFNVSEETGKQQLNNIGGGNRFPITVVGRRRVEGSNSMQIISTLAEEIGPNTLTYLEQGVM